MYLVVSFFIGKVDCPECCHCGNTCNCDDCCKECKCNSDNIKCDGLNCENPLGLCILIIILIVALFLLILAVAIIVGFFYLIYFLTKSCGKELTRFISYTIISLTNFVILILACITVSNEKEIAIFIIIGFSGILFISDFLLVLLCFKKKELKQTIMTDNLDYNLEKESQETYIPSQASDLYIPKI